MYTINSYRNNLIFLPLYGDFCTFFPTIGNIIPSVDPVLDKQEDCIAETSTISDLRIRGIE